MNIFFLAMQGYVLEHAFDLILDSGEIPHPSIFLEMVVQTAAQSDYERAVVLISVMAHAPFQVSEDQWTELFMKNKDRFGKECWENLLNALDQCSVSEEATITNLVRSLHNLDKEENNVETCRDSLSETNVSLLGGEGRIMGEDNDPSTLDSIISRFSRCYSSDEDGDEDDDVEFEEDESTLPSPDEILEIWKEKRHKDGIFLPFQL